MGTGRGGKTKRVSKAKFRAVVTFGGYWLLNQKEAQRGTLITCFLFEMETGYMVLLLFLLIFKWNII